MHKFIITGVLCIVCVGILVLVFKYMTFSPENISNVSTASPYNENSLPTGEDVVNNQNNSQTKFVEIGGEYDNVDYPGSMYGKLYFFAEKNGTKYIIYDGKVSWTNNDNSHILNLLTVGAWIVTFETTNNGKHFIVYQDKIIGDAYDNIYSPVELNEKLVYIAKKDGKMFIVNDGANILTKYNNIGYLSNIGGRLAYVVGDANGQGVSIVYDGKEFGQKYTERKDGTTVSYPTDVNDELAYTVVNGVKYFIVYNGQEFGKEYDSAAFPVGLNNKLAYVAFKNNKSFVVYDGEKVSNDYDSISSLKVLDGKLVFVAKKDNKKIIVVQK